MNNLVNATALVMLLTTSLCAQGQQVYRCKNNSGGFEYSDAPCIASGGAERIRIQPNSLDHTGSRELLLRKENEELRQQLRRQEQANAAQGSPQSRTQSDLQAERIDKFECEKARRDYQVTAGSNSNSKALIDAKRSAMYGLCGMREPDRTQVDINLQNDITINNRMGR